MTAQMDSFKHGISSTTHLIGQDWQKMIDLIESRPGDTDIKSFDGGGSHHNYRAEDNILRALQDVKRLRQKDMPLFGRCPETDNFYTVVCASCSMILMPHALKEHWDKRHGDNNKPYSPIDKQTIDSPSKSKSKKLTQSLKSDKIDKSKKIKPSHLTDLMGDSIKELKRIDKSKKSKSGEKLIDPENLSQVQRNDRVKQKGARFASELQPVVALSPIHVSENGSESNDSKDLPKSRRRDKKKNDRKADKIFDPDKHCGVINDNGKPCVRSILCKVHQVALKRAVLSRTMPYDVLIRILKCQNDEDKIKAENGLNRSHKGERGEKILIDLKESSNEQISTLNLQSSRIWKGDQSCIRADEPPNKRLKIKEEIIEDDVDQSQFTLPSHLEALIDETLKTLKDVDDAEPLPIIPLIPKPEPLVKWDFEINAPPKSPSLPPHIVLDDIHWHSSHPKPLATNTFGCRLIGGLMSTCKKLDTLRKHLQSVWSSSTSSPSSIRSGFNDVYSSTTTPAANPSNLNSKNGFAVSKYVKMPNQNKGSGVAKKNLPSVLTKNITGVKRKRRSNSGVITPVQNMTSNASDIISGLLISNSVPVQRTGSASVSTLPTGVIPVNSITGNGVPLRLFQGSLPVIASGASNKPATFIQLNLCPPK